MTTLSPVYSEKPRDGSSRRRAARTGGRSRSGQAGFPAGLFLFLMALLPIVLGYGHQGMNLPPAYQNLQNALIHGFALAAALALPLADPFKAWSALGLALCAVGNLLPLLVKASWSPLAGLGTHFLGIALLGLSFVTWLNRNFAVEVTPAILPPAPVRELPPPVQAPRPVDPDKTKEFGTISATGMEVKIAELSKDLAFMEELDRGLMVCVPAQVLILSADLRVKLCNSQFREFFRLVTDEEAGKDLNTLIPNKDLLKAVQETIGKKDVRELELRHYVKKVGEKRLLARIFGGLDGLVILCMQELYEVSEATNVNRLPKTQIINVQSEKLQLAGGIFGEMEQNVLPILESLGGSVNALVNSSDVQGRVRDALKTVQMQLVTAKKLFQTYQKVAEQHLEMQEKIQVTQIVEGALDPKNYPFDLAGISITKDFGLHRPKVETNEKQLRQAFVNLFTNAFEAIRRSGVPSGEVLVKIEEASGRVRVSIADNGGGMPGDQLKSLFKGGFSSKSGGAGLGLVTAQRIVQGSKGSITAESEQGVGSVLTVEMLVA